MVVATPLLAAATLTFLPLVTLPVNATLASRGSELQHKHEHASHTHLQDLSAG